MAAKSTRMRHRLAATCSQSFTTRLLPRARRVRKTRTLLFGESTRRLELLVTPIQRLGLQLETSPFAPLIADLYGELERAGIDLRPTFYLSTEYGCVEGTANIGLGFWDCDPDLHELNTELRAFSYSEKDIRALLRHEFGHAFCYSYKLYREAEFRRVFNVVGSFFDSYPADDRYTPNPWSKAFVNPCGDHYAQKHPDEDFAETVSVWLDPESNWRKTYQHKPGALRKLEYVGRVLARSGHAAVKQKNDPASLHIPLEQVNATVGDFLRAPMGRYRKRAPAFLDPDLKVLFRSRPAKKNGVCAAPEFVEANRRLLIDRITQWTGVADVVVIDLLDKVSERARMLDLVLRRQERDRKLVDLSAYLTTMATRYKLKETFASA
ncbi:MAG: hypothetical protein HZA54_13415 [Planctomycetes bacterium]|nr:hypothetical protein [Planctomycetota bacterium]